MQHPSLAVVLILQITDAIQIGNCTNPAFRRIGILCLAAIGIGHAGQQVILIFIADGAAYPVGNLRDFVFRIKEG